MMTLFCKCGKRIELDDNDYDKVKDIPFQCNGKSIQHMKREGGQTRHTSMASFIMDDPQMFDHADQNNHNMQRFNLRPATKSQNNQNRPLQKNSTTGYKGVSRIYNGKGTRFQAHIKKDGKKIHLGTFNNPIDAALAYNSEAVRLFGEFASLNLF